MSQRDEVVVEPWGRDTETLQWAPVVRFFVGGPLDGRALEGPDSREWEAGPMAATADYWYDGWILYEPEGEDKERDWIIYVLNPTELLRRARKKYIVTDEISFDEFEQAIDWVLAIEGRSE